MPPKITGKSRLPLGPRIRCILAAGASFASALLAGCSRAPSFNILGSFFPAWIVCGVIGILLAVALRLFFVRIKLEDQLVAPLIVVYPCLTAFFTFTLWLLFFS
jgi:cation transporter-like permease